MRLLKFLSQSIAMSPNQAGFFILKGRVSVDGKVIKDPNAIVDETQEVVFDKKVIHIPEYTHIVLHKPTAYSCTSKGGDHPSVLSLIDHDHEDDYFYFANTLPQDMTGLVLVSDNVRWTRRISDKAAKRKKVFSVKARRPVHGDHIARLHTVLQSLTEDGAISEADCQVIGDNVLHLSVLKGCPATIKMLFKDAELEVEHICLRQLGKLTLENLSEGQYRQLSADQAKI